MTGCTYLRVYMQNGADVLQKSANGRTPLHEACQGGHVAVARFIFLYQPEIDAQDREGRSAAHLSAFHGEVKCLELLTDKGK